MKTALKSRLGRPKELPADAVPLTVYMSQVVIEQLRVKAAEDGKLLATWIREQLGRLAK